MGISDAWLADLAFDTLKVARLASRHEVTHDPNSKVAEGVPDE
jgi:hypothetical protein